CRFIWTTCAMPSASSPGWRETGASSCPLRRRFGQRGSACSSIGSACRGWSIAGCPMPLIDVNDLGRWLPWMNLLWGLPCLVVGLRARGRTGELLAPVGAMAVANSALYFLWGTLPNAVMIALYVIALVAITLWFVRLYRASRARIRELLKRRDAS